MAIEYTLTFGKNSTEPYGELYVKETATSTSANTSTVSYRLTLKRPYSISSSSTKTASCTIDGKTYTWSGSVGGSGDKVLISGTQTVDHNTDGTKTINFSASIEFGSIYWSYTGRNLGTKSGSGSLALSEIPRYPTITQSYSDATETTLTIAWSSDSVCDALWWSTDGGSSWSALQSINAKSGTYTITGLSAGTDYHIVTSVRRKDSQLYKNSSVLNTSTYDFPHAYALPEITVEHSATLKFYNPLGRSYRLDLITSSGTVVNLETSTKVLSYAIPASNALNSALYNSISALETSSTYSIRCTYASNQRTRTDGVVKLDSSLCKPKIGSLTYVDTNSTAVAITGNNKNIVQNQSTPKYTASNVVPVHGSTIARCALVVNGTSYTMSQIQEGTYEIQGGVINSGTSVDAVVTVTDSRGFKTSKTVSVNMLAWSNPTAIITAWRENNYYSESHITVDASFASIGSNAVTITYWYREKGGTWSSAITLSDNVQYDFTADNTKMWELYVRVEDSFGGRTNYTVLLQKGVPLIYFDRVRNSIGFNRFPAGDEVADIYTICQASGSSNTATALSSGAMKQVILEESNSITVGDGMEVSSDGGIKVLHDGIYKVSGSAFINATSGGHGTSKDVFVSKGSSYSSSTEVLAVSDDIYTTGQAQQGAVSLPTKLIRASAGDIFYLYVRVRSGTGNVYFGNESTFLLLERVQ